MPALATPLCQTISHAGVTSNFYLAWLHPTSGLTTTTTDVTPDNATMIRKVTHNGTTTDVGGLSYAAQRRLDVEGTPLVRDTRVVLCRGGTSTASMTQSPDGSPLGIGALITWSDSSRHFVAFNTSGGGTMTGTYSNKIVGAAAWFRREPPGDQSGIYTDWVLVGGTHLRVNAFDPGEASPFDLLESDVECSATYRTFQLPGTGTFVRKLEVHVPSLTVVPPETETGTEITCYAPGVTEVWLNGVAITPTTTPGGYVIIAL